VYECTAGNADGGCNTDPQFWPKAKASCSACCDGTKCQH
jgi:hypothetical protein